MAAQRVKKDTDLGKICTEGETVRTSFGPQKTKSHYQGRYTDGRIAYIALGGHEELTSPSGFAEVMGGAHFGHSQSYNGWVKCTVLRDGAWVTLDSLRSPAPAAAEAEEAAEEPVTAVVLADILRLAASINFSTPARKREFIAGVIGLCSDHA